MATNVNDLYTDVLIKLGWAKEEPSRNGRVKSIEEPVLYYMENPKERVLFNPQRMCNPYLHVMETVWMFSGSKDVNFLLPFSQQMRQYAESDGTINGAYGHRWRTHFEKDQIAVVIGMLRADKTSRQAVIGMYDPSQDSSEHWKDRPCNTHLYFRVVDGKLQMTVCNRSNDAVWGMCGANVVHMTYLQELVASAIQVPCGRYYVMSNNLHIYEHHWDLMKDPKTWDYYREGLAEPYPLLDGTIDYWEFLNECRSFVANGEKGYYTSNWINNVVRPMYNHYMCRLNGDYVTYDIEETLATDWRLAEKHWMESHK